MEEVKKYYIISLKHTKPTDAFFTFWRANNSGYSLYKEGAGLYEGFEKGYHDTEDSLPVTEEFLQGLFLKFRNEEGKSVQGVPVHAATLKTLGIKKKGANLIKI